MGPVRTSRQKRRDDSSSSKPSTSKHKFQRQGEDSSSTPGVQKIKAALRQTRRLLAKDKLAANVRVETERRLKSLEADLAQAELARKERALASKYHMVKFFEKQKVTRKLLQTKRKLSSGNFGDDSKEVLERRLQDLRVDLNYILHYPKTKKYVSLFPPEVRQGEAAIPSSASTEAAREELRSWIRDCMSNGEIPPDPEMSLEEKGTTRHKQPSAKPTKTDPAPKSQRREPTPEEVDPFFGEDGDEEDDQ
ncbi:18S rRNA maturation protein [Pleurotus ostreatus]|nr:18S rRNA maturation protein [Pleurotus ostreatus]